MYETNQSGHGREVDPKKIDEYMESQESSRSPDVSTPGLIQRGEPMPQTVAEWKYLAGLYEKQILEDKETISKLKQRNNVLEQRNWR